MSFETFSSFLFYQSFIPSEISPPGDNLLLSFVCFRALAHLKKKVFLAHTPYDNLV